MPHLFGLQILHLVAVGDSRTGILVRWRQQPVSASGCGTSGAALALAASELKELSAMSFGTNSTASSCG
jgi:hypothetical protein